MAHGAETRRWKLVGGALCLDFVNTVGGRRGTLAAGRARASHWPVIEERLSRYEDLLSWAQAAGAVAGGAAARLRRQAVHENAGAARVRARAVTLREALFRVFAAVAAGRVPDADDLHILNGELAIARAHERLTARSGAVTWSWDEEGAALDRPLWPIARAAGDLLTSDARDRVRQCAGDDCGWLFLDRTRNRSRQWCDMRDCGNLAKIRRFRQRARRLARRARPRATALSRPA